MIFDGFCRIVAETHPRPIFTTAQISPRPAIARASPRFAERRRCLVWLGAALGSRRGHSGARRRRDPYKRIARSRNSTRRAYRASTPLATKGQLQRPVLVSTSARETGLPRLFPGAVLVAEGGSTFAAVEVSNSCVATAPRRRRRNKPKTSHGAGRLRHTINTGRRG